jgi:hypothetical protein
MVKDISNYVSMSKNVALYIIFAIIFGVVVWTIVQNSNRVPETSTVADRTHSEEQFDQDYVRLSESAAEELATKRGVPFRVVERDGEMLPTTRDLREGRINAVVTGGIVTSYTVESGNRVPDSEERGIGEGDPDANGYDTGSDTPEIPETDTEHDEIIGMTEIEAKAYADANDVPFRVGFIDGEAQALTMDYRPGRITARVDDGIVTGYTVE